MKLDSGIVKTIAIVLVITIIVALILRHVMEKNGFYDTDSSAQKTDDSKVSEEMIDTTTPEVEEEAALPAPGNGYDKVTSDKTVSSYDCVQIEKIYTVITDDGLGNQEMDYTRYYLSDVNLKNYTDSTSDYSQAVGVDAFDDEKVAKIEFSDAFGFSYENCADLSEFFENARKGSGFDADLTDASYDEEKYSLNKEESYEFNGDCSILYTMLGDMDYDKLLQSTCYYTLSRGDDGAKYPVMFTAIVQYEKDGLTITRTAYLGFNYYHVGEETGCNCGNGNECNTDSCSEGASCGCESENGSCGCNGSDPCPACGGVGGCKEGCTGDCCK